MLIIVSCFTSLWYIIIYEKSKFLNMKGENMIYTDNTKKALKLCFDAHKDQKDKSGLPYVFHPFHLAEQMDDENSVIVALLHDVVEDSDMSFEDLESMGFNQEIIETLKLLTHEKDVDYFDYVNKIKENELAKKVKLADLRHNSDISRLEKISEKDVERRKKYLKAIKILEK